MEVEFIMQALQYLSINKLRGNPYGLGINYVSYAHIFPILHIL